MNAAPAPQGPAPQEPAGRAPRGRCLRRCLTGGALLLLVGGLAAYAFLQSCFARPPELPARPAILDATPAPDPLSERVRLGAAWFQERPGGSLLYLEGEPFALGYANATLTARFLGIQEESLHATVRAAFPSRAAQLALATLVLVNNRSLPEFVPAEYRLEILGLASAERGADPYRRFGSRYHRILNYHAAHDIAHWVWDKPVLGCTAFAAGGARTAGEHLLVGRNFDFEAGRHFDTNKIIACVRPAGGHAFLSVAWPGMAGAVTGLNDARLYCSINGAHAAAQGRIGIPVSLLVRQVLQYAGDIPSAVALIRAAPVFVSDSYLLADGKTGRAVVVEKTPAQTEVRELEDGLLLQANHFESPGLARDPGNLRHMAEGSTVARRARLAELLEAASGALTPARAVAILRDRAGPGGKPLALGNRSALNPLIATHAVVADVTAGILWVSRGPHQLGPFEAHAIADFGQPAAPPIPADPLREDPACGRLAEARRLLDEAEGGGPGARAALEQVLELNPGDPVALLLLARAAEAAGREKEALEHYRAALAGEPPFAAHRREVAEAMARLVAPR